MFSSSKGNSTYLAGGGTALLIDAGVPFRSLCAALASQGLELSELAAVLITHEHTDHIRGLCTLLRKRRLPVCASAGTLDYLAGSGFLPPGTELIEASGDFSVGALQIRAFPTPHDAADSVGYRFLLPDRTAVAIATDLGHVDETVRENLTGCGVVMLESNYDRGMLDCSCYPYYLKRRIKSSRGHLSNEHCAAEVLRLVRGGATRVILSHLSEQNNHPSLAREVVRSTLQAEGMRENEDYILRVAPARAPREMLVF